MTELAVTDPSGVLVEDHFTRLNKYPNQMNFSEEQLKRRERELKILQRDYPDVCVSWLELVWNYCESTPMEEQERVIKEKLWESKPKEREMGGVITDAITVERSDSALLEN